MMNRFDFLSSLPFLSPCDVVDDISASTSNTTVLRGLCLSVEAYERFGASHQHIFGGTENGAGTATPDRHHATTMIDTDHDVRPKILGPLYFTTTKGFTDTTVTTVDATLDTIHRHLTLTVRPTTDEDAKRGFYLDGNNNDAHTTHYYRILRSPNRVEYMDAVENIHPPFVVLYFAGCALRFFVEGPGSSDDNNNNKKDTSLSVLFQTLQTWEQQQQQPPKFDHYHPTPYATAASSSPTTPSISPPAAQTVEGSSESTREPATKRSRYSNNNNSSSSNNNHVEARAQAYRDTCHQLRNVRTLLSQPLVPGGVGEDISTGNTTGPLPKHDAVQLLQQLLQQQPLTLQSAVYCEDDRRAMAQQMQRLSDDQLRVQQELRRALDAYFPVPRTRRPHQAHRKEQRGRERNTKNVSHPAETTTTSTEPPSSPPPPAEELIPQIETLLMQHEALAVERHALGISAMPRFLS